MDTIKFTIIYVRGHHEKYLIELCKLQYIKRFITEYYQKQKYGT